MSLSVLDPANQNKTLSANVLTVAQYILEQLAVWGVKRIFGVIGDANLYLLDALAKQSKIQYIACKHEGSAALMASAEAKLTGRVAVCLATSGPGIANLINGLADAAMDHAGVLVLTGQVDEPHIGTHTKQYINQQQLISPIAEKSELLAHPDALPEILQECLVRAKMFGAVTHLSIPKDLYTLKVQGKVKGYPEHLHQELLTPEGKIKEAADMLQGAQRPLFLLGRGAQDSAAQIQQLAETVQAAVVTTYTARSFFPNNHELYSGGLGQAGSEASTILLDESDLIVILGGTWWPEGYTPMQPRILQIDKSPVQMGIGHEIAMGLVGDLKQIVPKLLQMALPTGAARDAWKLRIKEVTESWKATIVRETQQETAPMAPQRVIHTLSNLAAPNAIIAVDTGDHTLWLNRVFQAKQQEFLISGRWRTLGFGLPAAIAAQLEYPDRQVIAVVGDGGVVQTLMEFQTAVQLGLPIVVLIMNNGSYAMEKNRMETAGLQTLGSVLVNPDFAKIAEACGGMGRRVQSPQQLEQELRSALEQRKPCILDVQIQAAVVPHTKL
ncbi:thiamine pyrophosphate-binding protein [Paenibacillus sp. OAS669]|uniref:thiamine pyrophosphate-binding protein n=1 Tax=Paenibacillus sp. OAS669 TaxID=2663821 RepID=UPI00178907EB|nr:thiamine pyrophosphate-binding protein [Paenibacillus sp. OAS669]MBE1442810.1 pyruvate dehydrogenase (quinone)/pyruvate oxidase [Paenibacillus sp. OAS669]